MKQFKILIICCLFITNLVRSQVSVYAKVDHLEPDGVDTLGNITLTVSGSTAPYTYTWNPGAINTKDISNITAGQYTLNVRSASAQTYSNFYKLGYKALWTNLYRLTNRNDSLFIPGTTSSLYGSASSKNTLTASTDGWFEYVVVGNVSTYISYIGFTDSISPVTVPSDIDYGVYIQGSALYSVHTGTTATAIKTGIKIGDVVRVERTGNVIKYSVNNVTLKTITVTGVSSKTFKLKAIFTGNTMFANVGCSFSNLTNTDMPNYVKVKPFIKHASGSGTTDGLIKVSPDVPFANTYSWSPGGATTNSITSSFGNYKVTVKDSLNNTSNRYLRIGYKTQWINVDRGYFRNDSLVSTAVGSSIYSSACTKNILKPNINGWFEYVLSYKGQDCQIGFIDSLSPYNFTGNSIDYGFLVDGTTGYLYYLENANPVLLNNALSLGDVLAIERVGNSIWYKQNGAIIRSVTVSGLSQKALRLQCYMFANNRITDVGCSFLENDSVTFKNYVNVKPLIKHSSGFGINDGSIKLTPKIPFTNTYSWTPGGATTNSISSVGIGNYSVMVTDSLQNKSPYQYNIGYKVKWTNLDKCIFRNDSLIGTGNNAQVSTAVSKNTLKPGENGWSEIVVDKLWTTDFYFGLSDNISSNVGTVSLQDIDYGFFYDASSKLLYYYESGTSTLFYTVLQVGHRLKIERAGNSIIYRINGAGVRSVTVSDIGSKSFKLKANIFYNEKLNNIGSSFYKTDSTTMDNYVQVIPLVKHSSGVGINDGSISVKPRLSGLQSYTWQPSGINTATLSSLNIGTNTITVMDSSANQSASIYNVGYKAQWKNLINGFSRNDTLKGTSTIGNYVYACTKNILSNNVDGWFEYVISSLPAYNQYIGFVDSSANNSTIITDIQYGFYYYGASKYIYFLENGANAGSWLTPRIGDVMRIERVGNTINYKINGRNFKTLTNVAIGPKVLKLKARLQYNTYLTNVGVSFPECDLNVSAGTTQTITTLSPSVTLTGTTSLTSGATYSWSPGGSTPTSSTTVVSSGGIYTLKITNALGCSNASTVQVLGDVSAFNNTYVTLKPKLDGGYYQVNDGKLYFKFREEYENTNNQLNYKIYDKNRAVVISNTTAGATLNLLYKDNRFTLDVLGIAPSMPNGYYVLEVEDKKGQILMLRFKL